jgi:hypothetical protein
MEGSARPGDKLMEGSSSRPKVFISYSWTSLQHEQWVLGLAERLSGDGIVVTLDKWDLKEGQDKHVFMEQMVHDESIAKVLVVCDLGYQSKADDRRGGMGTETQMISKKVYENTAQEKFIPIVRQYDKDGKPCIPHFMASRIYIDLSSDETFEENYQKLVRNLYGKPVLRRPPLGDAPAYITEEDQILLKTSRKVGAIKDALLNERRSSGGLVSDFLETVLSSLEDFRLTGGSVLGFDDKVASSIEKMLPLRDDFIDFTFTLFKYRESVDLDQLHDFWEKLIAFTFRPENVQSWAEIDYDNFRFFNYELMLGFMAVLLRLRRYQEAGFFIQSRYFYRTDTNDFRQNGIEMFNRYVRSLDEFRNHRLGLQRVSVTADLIKARATRKDLSFSDIRETDLTLHYVTALRGGRFEWFPRTSTYGGRGSRIELFDRMVSSRHFEKIKALFGVNEVGEIKALISQYLERNKNDQYGHSSLWNYDIRSLENVIDPQNLAAIP